MRPLDRDPVATSYWQFDPGVDDAEVAALPAVVSVVASDVDKVNLIVLGRKSARRYEDGDSAWLEMSDSEALKLVERIVVIVRGRSRSC